MRDKQDNGPYNIFAETELIVEFNDLDPMNIVWHVNYFNYFEAARSVLLQKLEYDYYKMEESGYVFPVVDISARYLESLKYKDKIVVKAILIEYENRLKIRYEIRNAQTGKLTTKGVSVHMAINVKSGESCFVCPQILYDKVESLMGTFKN